LEVAKLVIPLLTGMLIFAGATLSFVNARLVEAKNADARSNVISVTIASLSMACVICASVAAYFGLLWPWIFLSVAATVFNIFAFLRSTAPLTRAGIVMAAGSSARHGAGKRRCDRRARSPSHHAPNPPTSPQANSVCHHGLARAYWHVGLSRLLCDCSRGVHVSLFVCVADRKVVAAPMVAS